MTYKSQWMLAGGLIAALTFASVPAVAQQNSPTLSPQKVLVVNGTGQPVPTAPQGTTKVDGTVNIGNTPSVNVANTPNVTLESGASVNVSNPLDGQGNPKPLATLEAVQVYASHCGFIFGGNNSGSCDFTAVPQGKQLTVQEFDASGYVEPGNRPYYITLDGTLAGGNYFLYTFMNNDGIGDTLATHQETRVYVSQGNTPVCAAKMVQNSNGNYYCNISGFLVDAPFDSNSIVAPPQQKRLPLPFGRH